MTRRRGTLPLFPAGQLLGKEQLPYTNEEEEAADREAFSEWMESTVTPNVGWLAMPGNAIARSRHLRTLLYMAYRAGAKRRSL